MVGLLQRYIKDGRLWGVEVLYSQQPYILLKFTTPEEVRSFFRSLGCDSATLATYLHLVAQSYILTLYRKDSVVASYSHARDILGIEDQDDFHPDSHLKEEFLTVLEQANVLSTEIKLDISLGRLDNHDIRVIGANPKYSFLYARDFLGAPFPAGEPSIAKCPEYSYRYALNILKAPFPAGEASIASSALYSYEYAYWILGQTPFPAGESSIASSAEYSYQYAHYVLDKPFPAGESSIASSAECSYQYAYYVLEKPFPAGESSIASSAQYSYRYARDVLGQKPFPAGEPVIASSAEYSYWYAFHILDASFPAGEEVIAFDSMFSIEYAKHVLHEPNPELWYQKRKMVKGDFNPWVNLG